MSHRSSKAIAGKELSLSSWCIASLYIYHFSTVIDFSSEKYSGSTGHRNSWYQQRNLQWGCQWWVSNSQPLDYKPSALAIEPQELKSYSWEGVEFIQLVYCIIIYLSFLNCDWLLIREVQWFYWTQELLVPAEKFTVRMPMVSLELATPGLQTQCSSHWATGAQMLLLGRSWVYPVGVLHHYIFIISQLWLTSHPRSTVVLLDTGTPGTSREIYSEDANGESRTRNPWITNPVL